jgi:release factor glutamine methyltransferase
MPQSSSPLVFTSPFQTAKELHLAIVAHLQAAYEPREAENIAYFLLEKMYGLKRWDIWEKITFSEAQNLWLSQAILRLQAGEPLQYILGVADFYGLKLKVSPAVLIPRPETEELLDLILQKERKQQPLRILDIGTGSGAIAIALAKNLPSAEVWAIDVSQAALQVARQNAQQVGARVYFQLANILTAQAKDFPTFDVLVSNPPYIPENERQQMPLSVTEHEPALALFVPEGQPLLFYEKIAQFDALVKGGRLYYEVHEKQAQGVFEILCQRNFTDCHIQKDMQGKPRLVWGRKG